MSSPEPEPELRVLFVGAAAYDLPLDEGLARKWDAISRRMTVRVIGREGQVREPDERFRLIPPIAFSGLNQLRLPRVVASELRSFRPDVVVAQSAYEAVPVLLAMRRAQPRPKLLVEVHGDWRTATRVYGSSARRLLTPAADGLAEAALRRADATRALSPFTARLAREVTGRDPIAVFPTYSDLHSFQANPPQPMPDVPRAAWVGVLQPYKAPEVLAEAWRLVARELPEARLAVVGDGPQRPLIDRLVDDPDLHVEAYPRLAADEVARVFDESTVLLLPSRYEGLGRVIIEAHLRERPVIGTAAGGIPDILRDEENGLLIGMDDPQALAEATLRLMRDRELAGRMGRRGREIATEWTLSADQFAGTLRESLDTLVNR